ncbi:flavin-containing monooxygenase [Kineococcus gynurae]|uniref:Flavin-containing monooxygenase n=1 Tax=Kineococcus gynurae TaxID=452979 RepID=A0ABV5LTC6_9ACTN
MTETLDRPAADRAPDPAADPRERVDRWLSAFQAALDRGDGAAAAALFTADSSWRDLVAFTWNITTLEGRDAIADLVGSVAARVGATDLRVDDEPGWGVAAAGDGDGADAWLRFETAVGRGRGQLRLRRDPETGEDRAWTVLTTLFELTGHEENLGPRRPRGAEHGARRDRTTWSERRVASVESWGVDAEPFVLVIGAGQGGLALGARLKALGVPALLVEKGVRPGQSWANRYKSLCLHDPVWYDHLPYLDFPKNWPVFAPKDKIADWLEFYAKVMELDVWCDTACESASFDEETKVWTVRVRRGGELRELHPTHLVLATGMSGKPSVPTIPGQDVFRGEQHHSSAHPGPDGLVGRRVVVIGANNSAHDISAALWENGVDVTMVQRSSTHIVRSDSLMELALGGLYSEEAVAAGVSTTQADLTFASIPYRVMPEFHIPVYEEIRRRDADFYRRLEEAGFLLDFGDDGSGLFLKYLRRGSGYYIDVGASELVADGSIKLRSGVDVDHLTEDAVVLSDGSVLPADVVVYATGFGSMNGWAADLISPEVADRVGKVWGLGSGTTKDPGPWEGEERNMWKPTRQENLWFHGGNLHQSRHYSLYLALQLTARYAGIETPVHRLAEVHHTS